MVQIVLYLMSMDAEMSAGSTPYDWKRIAVLRFQATHDDGNRTA